MIIGAKKGQKQQQKPNIAKDDLVSTSYFKGLYGLAEGEIFGLADGGKSIRLDGTPIVNDNGQANFDGVTWEFRTGTLDQEHIAGFSAVENERNVGVELRHDRPYVQAINNVSLSAVRLRLNFNALREQKDNGDITGYAIEYAVDVQTDGGVFVELLKNTVRGKASQGFKKSHRIDLPKASKNWTIRVRRITPNRDSDLIADTVSIDAITEIIDAKLRYPATALLGLTYDAATFSNIAKIAVRLKGKLIKVPTNYNAETRTYSGLWDGRFKLAYSNNPAWVLYDICTHKRYGLGERLANMVDKWRLYQIAQYCDEPVDDGKGGKEPRFAINVYIQKDEDAYKVIQNIASVFRGLSYWDGTQIVVDSDTPKDPVYTFSPANIVGGEFSYTGTRARDRHTVVKAAWDNPDNDYKTEYELVRDEQGIAKYGIRTLDITVFGCTSQGQAQRAGQWALKSEQLETRTVSFKTGLQGFIPQVGQVINIADNVFAGRAISGRVVSHNAQTMTLDRQAGKVGDTIAVNHDGVQTATITAVNGVVITTDKALNIADDAVWAVISDDLSLMQFRILTIAQNDDATFDITALQYEPQKYGAVDSGAVVTPTPVTVLKATPIHAPATVTISQSVRTVQGQSVTTMTINWTQAQGAVAYRVRWRKDDGNWQTIPKLSGQSVDIDGVYSGHYIAEVQAIDAFDNESLATSSQLTAITGKVGKPPRLARITATGKLFGMDITWVFNAGSSDTAYTEIQVSPDGRSNIATLGTFAYPTDKHTINGLQGNLTQFYRARIVDKLGNVSDWTAWTSGTTDAGADKVLSLLTGQITASQLHQDLSTPIGKIGTLETGLNLVTPKVTSLESSIASVNSNLASLNANMTTAKADIAKAKTDLSTAISNITTERNRITSAIADITVLQSANNAKTQELANLTQTVGTHTSSIRDLGVTTGDLSQKYTQLKSASDTANSEITAIKQTQNGQAVQIDKLQSRYSDNLLTSHDSVTTTSYLMANIALRRILTQGQKVVITVYADLGDDRTGLTLTNTTPHGASALHRFNKTDNGVYQVVVPWNVGVGANNSVLIYHTPQSATSASTLHHAHVTLADAMTAQTDASISTLQQTLTAADSALSQRIDTLDASYKSADTALGASVTAETQARTTADNALSQRITALDTAYKSADTSTNAKLATLEQSVADKDGAMSRRVDTLQASYNTLDSTKASVASVTAETQARTTADNALSQRIDSLNSDYQGNKSSVASQLKTLSDKDSATASQISSLTADVTTAQNTANTATNKADNALNRANTANSAITAEQTARVDADNALSQRITALDTAYKSADSALTARVATAEQSITTANQAIATTQQTLHSRFDSLAVGGRNLVINSDKAETWTNFVRSNIAQTSELGFKTPVMRISCTQDTWYAQKTAQSTNNVRQGESYVLSFSAKSNSSINNTFVYGDGNVRQRLITSDSVIGETWQHIKIAFVASADMSNVGVMIGGHGTANQSYVDIAEVKLEKGNVPTDWTPAPEDMDSATSAVQANLDEFKRTEALANSALSQRIDSLNTSLGTKASAAALDSLTTKVNQVDGKLTSEASKVSTLQTTVNGQTALIQQHSQSINGLSAQWTLKAESNGIVSGIGLASSNGVSDFAVRANKFYVASPTGTTKTPLFSVLTTPTTVGGVSVPAGVYLSSAYIQNGSIANAHIANGAITTAKIGDAQISNAHIANGAITTAKIGTAQVDTLQIAGEAVIVPRVQFTQNEQSFYSIDTEEEINRISLDAQGGAVAISFGFERLYAKINNRGNDPTIYLRIKRGSTVLRVLRFKPHNKIIGAELYQEIQGRGENAIITTKARLLYDDFDYEFIALPTITDNPPSGLQTYTVTLESRGLNAGKNSSQQADTPVAITARSLQIMAVKR